MILINLGILILSAMNVQIHGSIDYYTNIYEELNCLPTYVNGDQTANPLYYTCPYNYDDPKVCYHRGKAYKYHEVVPQSQNENACVRSCRCQKGLKNAKFTCAKIDCIWMDMISTDKCLPLYKANICCPQWVCGARHISALSTCAYNNETYVAGQQFNPIDTCLSCQCTKEFNGIANINSPYCHKLNCGYELLYQDKLQSKCAPVYQKGLKCCPIDWVCQSNKTKIHRTQSTQSNQKCLFGKEMLNIGDVIHVDNPCLVCECKLPPLATCESKPLCGV